jgi:hypothetical protein
LIINLYRSWRRARGAVEFEIFEEPAHIDGGDGDVKRRK